MYTKNRVHVAKSSGAGTYYGVIKFCGGQFSRIVSFWYVHRVWISFCGFTWNCFINLIYWGRVFVGGETNENWAPANFNESFKTGRSPLLSQFTLTTCECPLKKLGVIDTAPYQKWINFMAKNERVFLLIWMMRMGINNS